MACKEKTKITWTGILEIGLWINLDQTWFGLLVFIFTSDRAALSVIAIKCPCSIGQPIVIIPMYVCAYFWFNQIQITWPNHNRVHRYANSNWATERSVVMYCKCSSYSVDIPPQTLSSMSSYSQDCWILEEVNVPSHCPKAVLKHGWPIEIRRGFGLLVLRLALDDFLSQIWLCVCNPKG